MKPYAITNQRDLRRAFWEAHPTLSNSKMRALQSHWCGPDYPTDTRVAFVDWIDSLCRDGTISEALAHRATLD